MINHQPENLSDLSAAVDKMLRVFLFFFFHWKSLKIYLPLLTFTKRVKNPRNHADTLRLWF